MLRRVRESGFANQDQRRSRSQRAVGAAKKTISGLNPTTAKMALRPSSPTVLLFAAVARTYFGLFCFSTEKTFLYNFGVRQWEPPIATAWLCSLLAPWMHLNNHALWKKRRKKNDLLAATDCTNFATNQTKRPRNPLILRGETWPFTRGTMAARLLYPDRALRLRASLPRLPDGSHSKFRTD